MCKVHTHTHTHIIKHLELWEKEPYGFQPITTTLLAKTQSAWDTFVSQGPGLRVPTGLALEDMRHTVPAVISYLLCL